jgi:AraC-like DNA-binding protein
VKQQAETLLKDLDNTSSTRAQVEKLLLPVLRTGEASVEVVARKLGVSRQTLFRKLREEGVTFERVLDELRQKLAVTYLRTEKMSVNETAYLLGFSDPAAFSRAFKRWTGSSPRTLRNASLGAPIK